MLNMLRHTRMPVTIIRVIFHLKSENKMPKGKKREGKGFKAQLKIAKEILFSADKFGKHTPHEIWDLEYAEMDTKLIEIASMIYRKRAKAHCKFIKAYTACVGSTLLDNIPGFVCAAPVNGYIYLYPNLPAPTKTKGDLYYLSNLTCLLDSTDELLFKLGAVIKEGKADTGKAGKQFASEKLILKFIRKRVRMTISKFLTKYVFIEKNKKELPPVTSANVRDIAEQITDELKPVTLTFCETVEDIIRWYEGGAKSTCMSRASEHAKEWHELWDKEKFHPGTFYLYCPQLMPVMTMKCDKVVARTLLHRKDVSGPWKQYGVIYTSSTGQQSILLDLLKEMGIGKNDVVGKDSYDLTTPFNIPGIWSELRKDYLAPVPYMDTVRSTVMVWFDIQEKTFHFDPMFNKDGGAASSTCPKKYKAIKFNSRGLVGCLAAKDIFYTKHCDYCGEVVSGSIALADDGHTFCCTEHRSVAGYVKAIQADDARVYKLKDECFRDALEKSTYFTTEYAAYNNGHYKNYPYIEYAGQPVIMTKFTHTLSTLARIETPHGEKKVVVNADLYYQLQEQINGIWEFNLDGPIPLIVEKERRSYDKKEFKDIDW